ncbi:TPA: AAA family ATPase [Vibrio vulnificus]|uniref:AAA family ATPase n=1 Tax=Vibrio vulnificus TaxID=672 RepID=A0A8H9MYF8_VIBVL|nr:AAA family ATPase [Vibrio vulnificus]
MTMNIEQAIKDGGSFSVIRDKLTANSTDLFNAIKALDEKRKLEFGGVDLSVAGNINLLTESISKPVDIAKVGEILLFGFDGEIGLKSHIELSDMFAAYRLDKDENGKLEPHALALSETILNDEAFLTEFNRNTRHNRDVRLRQLFVENGTLFIIVSTNKGGKNFAHYTFKDSGSGFKFEQYNVHKPSRKVGASHEWVSTTKDDIISGVHSHISVANKVFVETIGGDLTIKTTNDTEDSKGIFSEDVAKKEQRITDAKVQYIDLGELVLLSITPLSEEPRYYVFNVPTQQVIRCDALANSWTEFDEGHGIVFSNGYAIAGGEMKVIDSEESTSVFHGKTSSPSGEDALYAFYNSEQGNYTIYHYNLVSKQVTPPIHSKGFTSRKDGKLLVFRTSENSNAEKLHSLQVWDSPFMSQENYVKLIASKPDTALTRIGNPTLVKGISDCLTILELTKRTEVSEALYESIIKTTNRLLDTHYWLADEECGSPKCKLMAIKDTAEQVLTEFKKVKEQSKSASERIVSLGEEFEEVKHACSTLQGFAPEPYIEALYKAKGFIGTLFSAKEIKFIDIVKIDNLLKESNNLKDTVVVKLIDRLQDKEAFNSFHTSIRDIEREAATCKTSKEYSEKVSNLNQISLRLTALNSEIGELETDDSTKITKIVSHLGDVFTSINTLTAKMKSTRKAMVEEELSEQFKVQMNQLSQIIEVSLSNANTPEECDIQAEELAVQFEKLELRFAESDTYIDELRKKSDEAQQSIENRKSSLKSERQAQIQKVIKSVESTIETIQKKIQTFGTIEEVHSYFKTNIAVERVRSNCKRLVELGDTVASDGFNQKIKTLKAEAVTNTRDRAEIFEDGGDIIKLGKSRFSVNKRKPELSLVTEGTKTVAVVSSTSFKQPIDDSRLSELSDYTSMIVPTESDTIYRGTYLAYLAIDKVISENLDSDGEITRLISKNYIERESKVDEIIRSIIKDNYDGGFTRGVHDLDAKLIFAKLYPLSISNGNSIASSTEVRIEAINYLMATGAKNERITSLMVSASSMKKIDIAVKTGAFDQSVANAANILNIDVATMHYLLDCYCVNEQISLTLPMEVVSLAEKVKEVIGEENVELVDLNVFSAFASSFESELNKDILKEAHRVFLALTCKQKIAIYKSERKTMFSTNGLIGEHVTISKGTLTGNSEEVLSLCKAHFEKHSVNFKKLVDLRSQISKEFEESLQLSELVAKPMAGFVRNELIKKSYIPLIGDSLANQIGSIDSSKASNNGGLMLISPPGYGKTTLLEYIAACMGFIFVKINGPAIGHNVTSIIPDESTSPEAAKELTKLNFALELGDNVIVLIDDIQHLSPEFLQKFISLCDGTRRIEGQWNGVTKTYDMKGKRFAIAMAGNPYTENGEAFKIPDMLSNRMTSRNLGDVSTGMEDAFELSYIENALTSNQYTEDLHSRDRDDFFKMIDMAKGHSAVASANLNYPYSQGELVEIIDVLKHMMTVQDIVLKVNRSYIQSAAQASSYRTEPPFLLQGSYRNMNKMCEKIVPVMTNEDIVNLISDHYKSESQTLTTKAEENFIRLKMMLGTDSEDDNARWANIVEIFMESQKPEEAEDVLQLKRIADALREMLPQ